eukprot:4642183-Pleurochrysis_carterae.AAC.1
MPGSPRLLPARPRRPALSPYTGKLTVQHLPPSKCTDVCNYSNIRSSVSTATNTHSHSRAAAR